MKITIQCTKCKNKNIIKADENVIEVARLHSFLFHSPEETFIEEYKDDEYADHTQMIIECEDCGHNIVLQDFYKPIK